MALPKKGLRKIVVNDPKFAWSATGNDDYINLSIVPFEKNGQLLTSNFKYHFKQISQTGLEDGSKVTHLKQQFIITPFIVRQVILYGLINGWTPNTIHLINIL